MGCDGGTIPTRDELVRLKKKPEKKDKNAELAAKWKHCAISQEPLQQPIVACELGRLYKKEKVIEYLLDKSKFESSENFEHIKGLKDVKELNLTENSAYKQEAAGKHGYVDHGVAEYMCPVTGLEMSGIYSFIMLWSCGCVFSERALKEIKSDYCHKCQKPFLLEDVVNLNASEEDMAKMRTNMEQRRLQAKLKKKEKKKHKVAAAAGSDEPPSKIMKIKEESTDTGDQPSTSSAAAKKVPTEVSSSQSAATNGKLTNGISSTKVKPSSAIGSKLSLPNSGVNKSLGIQKDPSASKVFKSLFTTCEKAKNQPKGHWVTYNPCYN